MRERPILFSGEMVKAILEGRKCMTRRVNSIGEYYLTNKKCPYGSIGDRLWVRETWRVGMEQEPYQEYKGIQYKAEETRPENVKDGLSIWIMPEARNMAVSPHWRPSIFMPRWASRITLEITSIRVERLQDITECDAEKEGMPDDYPIAPVYCPVCRGEGNIGACHPVSLGYIESDCQYCDTARKRFINLWDSINSKKPDKRWDANPWVWVVEFRRGDNV